MHSQQHPYGVHIFTARFFLLNPDKCVENTYAHFYAHLSIRLVHTLGPLSPVWHRLPPSSDSAAHKCIFDNWQVMEMKCRPFWS